MMKIVLFIRRSFNAGVFLLPGLLFITLNNYAQNVGIGTSTPTRAKLELHGSVLSTSAIFGGEATGISLQSNWPGIGFNEYSSNGFRYMANGYGAIQYLNPTNGYMTFGMMPSGIKDAIGTLNISMIISNTGNMGIRTNPINASLFVTKAGNFDGSAVFGGTSYNSHFNYGTTEDTYIRGGRNGSKVYINDINGGKIIMGNGTGYVGINNGPPAYSLEIRQVSGRGLLLVEPNNSFNNWEFRVERPVGWTESNLTLIYNGQYKGYFTWGTGFYETYSDRRLKTRIENLPGVLDKIMKLETVEYEMRHHNTKHEKTIGFIAQDVKKLFPELVTITTDTSRGYPGINDLHGLNYNGFTVLAIKAIQEQQQLIKKMKERNKELARRIEIAEAVVSGKN